jgi:hypothetical protein
MSDSIPTNDLDRAVIALGRSKAALPELMRQLGEGDLWFLVPYHPEVEGELIELKNGMPLPFSQFEEKDGPVVPLFSSFERAREAMKKSRLPARTFSTGSMPAKQVLAILGRLELRAELNKSCRTGGLILPPNMMRDVADGSALQPDTEHPPRVQGKLQILDPADYPTDLVQPAFEALRQHRNFRAAWIFERGKGQPTPGGGRRYQMLILMDPRDATIFHDFNLVVNAACQRIDELELGYLDESDAAYIANLWQKAPAFYTAADYQRPDGAKE